MEAWQNEDSYNIIASALGDAIFSGISKEIIWECTTLSKNKIEFFKIMQAAVKASDTIKRINSKK